MKKKIFIGSTILMVIVVAFAGWRFSTSTAQGQTDVQTFVLKKVDLVDSVLVSGTVKSSKSENVYSRVTNYPIKKVNVEVGDKVKAGDVLAQLDTDSLELDIRQSELNIRNAEASLKNENSSNDYSLKSALNSFETASLELKNSQKTYDQTKELYESGASSLDEFTKAELALKKAQLTYNNAQASLQNTKSKDITTTKNNIELQRVALEKQKKTLNDSRIIAPIDGTVTLANAKEGGSAAGLLFVVEDTENLIVSTQIGEYDISLVKPGQDVVIKTDSTGDKQFIGTVSKIAPTAVKDASGNIADTSNIQFDTEIALKDKDPNIKIGMTMRLTIKLSEKKDVYSVPHEAVFTEADGSQWINVLETAKDDSNSKNVSKKIKVQTGMETDMYVEVSSPDLKDGMDVLVNSKESAKKS